MPVNFVGVRHIIEALLPQVPRGGAVALISSVAGMGYREEPREAAASCCATTALRERARLVRREPGRRERLSRLEAGAERLHEAARLAARPARGPPELRCSRRPPIHRCFRSSTHRPAARRTSTSSSTLRSAALRRAAEMADPLILLNSDAARFVSGHRPRGRLRLPRRGPRRRAAGTPPVRGEGDERRRAARATTGRLQPIDAERFFREALPDAFAEHREEASPRARPHLRLRPLSIETPDAAATVLWRGDHAEVALGAGPRRQCRLAAPRRGVHATSCPISRHRWRCSARVRSTLPAGVSAICSIRWLVLRAALDGRAIHTPGSVTFRDRDGAPLDLDRAFAPDDDPAEMTPLPRTRPASCTCGALLDPARHGSDPRPTWTPRRAHYRDGDGRSWWVTMRDGARRLVRLQSLRCGVARRPRSSLEDPRFPADRSADRRRPPPPGPGR